jgi:hypothetical protein
MRPRWSIPSISVVGFIPSAEQVKDDTLLQRVRAEPAICHNAKTRLWQFRFLTCELAHSCGQVRTLEM